MNITQTEKGLNSWVQDPSDNPQDPTLTAAELTVSAKVLDRYTSEENLSELFYDRERAESLATFSADLLATYPNYPYHQPAHGVDVMHTAHLLTDMIPADKMSSNQKDLLLVAAAAHDAGFKAGPPPEGYVTKEHYAVSFLDEKYKPDSADYGFMESAILGTIIGPKEQVRRDGIEAKLLHHADLGYVWLSCGRDFLNYAMRFRIEECSEMSWREFQKLESLFLTNYQQHLEDDMRACGVAEKMIEQMMRQVAENRRFITDPELDEPSQEILQDWPMTHSHLRATLVKLFL